MGVLTQRQLNLIKKKLSKVKIGLPSKVTFQFEKGTVICWPKSRKWVIKPINKPAITFIVQKGNRNDVTKYKAGHLLRFALCELLRDDSLNKKK